MIRLGEEAAYYVSNTNPGGCQADMMVKRIEKFDSFEDAERANRRYYHGLTPQERLDILLDLVAAYRETQGEAAKRFARVYRVVKRPRR